MIRIECQEAKWKFPFVAYLPQQYEAMPKEKKLPLILQLHGAGERGCGGEELKLVEVHGFSRIVDQVDEECIIVMPQCPKDSFWAARVESIVALIGQLQEAFPVDPDRISMTGLSMGGFGTWYTAMAKPELFSAIAPHCGGGMAWNAGVLKMPVWIFHGAEDQTVSVNQSDEMANALKKLNYNVTYSRLEGVGHNVYQYTYNIELLHWLLAQKRG